jgi:FAD/FMN-containing dehydrogenase
MNTTTALNTQAWNVFADQRPDDVRVARSVEDVQDAIAHARANGLRVAPQTTGHYAGSLPALDGTLLLKLAFDEEVVVDPDARMARVPAGACWDEVVHAVTPHGLSVMHGSSPTVGVIGYLLGGGLSFYGRAHGLAVNHIRAFEVVTPDGELRRADANHNAEMFWALRGGGGGYAVVTAVEIGLLPYAEVTGGALFFAWDAARDLLRTWRDWTLTAPDAMTTTWRMLHAPDQAPVVCINGVSLDPAVAADLEQRLRAIATPVMGGFGPMPTAAVARLHGDPEDPSPVICDGILLDHLDDDALEDFLRVATPNSPLMVAELRHIGGALAAPPAHAGARGALEGQFVLFGLGAPGVSGTPERITEQLALMMRALRPAATGTRFTSFAGLWTSLRTCVPEAVFARLARLRAELDPDGLLVAPHLAS